MFIIIYGKRNMIPVVIVAMMMVVVLVVVVVVVAVQFEYSLGHFVFWGHFMSPKRKA